MAAPLAWIIAVILALVSVGRSATDAAVSAGTKVSISADWMVKAGDATTLLVTVSVGHGHTADLQLRAAPGSWTSLNTTRVVAEPDGTGRAAFAFVPRSGSHTYRVVVEKGGLRSVSNRVTIRTSTGSAYLAKARHYLGDYCPSTPLSATLPRNGALAGRATTSWSATEEYNDQGGVTTNYSWRQKIEFRAGLRDDVLRAVALHECAHIVQYRQLVKGMDFYFDQRRASDALYGGNGVEKQADCMAAAILKTSDYAVYARSCGKSQLADARALWTDYGGRYRDPSYAFALSN